MFITALAVLATTTSILAPSSASAQVEPAAIPPVSNQRNFAMGADATQSSTGFNAPANRATDEWTSGRWEVASTTSTTLQSNPWWQVDLGASRDIDLIRVWNREDCCAERLRDFWVFLSAKPFTSDDPNVLAADRAVTAIKVAQIPNPSVSLPVTALARYVRVQIPRTEILSLAEVEVIGQPWRTNFAPDAVVTQSSSRFDGDAFHANDANPDGDYSHHSVSHTQRTLNPWWQADLGFSRNLTEVRLWNRTDCCAQRLANFWVQVSDVPFTSNDPAVIARSPNVRSFLVNSIPSPLAIVPVNTTGRYVRIQLQGTEALSLAEVEILGPQLRDYVPGGIATQSSTGWGGIAEAAQDGSTRGEHARSSITHTTEQVNPWWQVNLGTARNITQVKIWNRTDCCADRLRDFWVYLSPYPFTSDNPAVTVTQPGVTAIRVQTIPSPSIALAIPNVPAQYIRVQIPGKGILSLAEVEAFGTETLAPVDAATWNARHPRSMYLNYGITTYKSSGTSPPGPAPSFFNPTATVNPSTWAAATASAKMKLAVFTAKIDDGFAMWPTAYSNYSIAASPYQGGRGDIVRDFTNAMRAANLEVGFQYSIFDRTNKNTQPFIKNQLRELLTRYGNIEFLYFSGWQFVPDSSHMLPYNDLRDYIRNISPGTIVGNDDTYFSLISSDLVTMRYKNGFTRLPKNTPDPKISTTPLDSSSTYFLEEATSAPQTWEWVRSIQQSLASVNSTLLLGVGPRKDGTIDPRSLTVLQQLGQNYP